MNLSSLLKLFNQIPTYNAIADAVHWGELTDDMRRPLGVMTAARPALLAALQADLQRPVLFITARADRARILTEQIQVWAQDPTTVYRLPDPDALPHEKVLWGIETIQGRLATLSALVTYTRSASINNEQAKINTSNSLPPLIISSARGLMHHTLPRSEFTIMEFKVGQRIKLNEVVAQWIELGYQPEDVVEVAGSFSRRGGLLDIFPPSSPNPIRIELFGDEIDSLRSFDPATQRSDHRLNAFIVGPATETLPRYAPHAAEQLSRWDFNNLQPGTKISFEEDDVIEETRHVVTKAIHSRLLSDVPVGSFLSSGIDSSIVTSIASQKLPNLKTFTIGFEDLADPYHGRADESKSAEKFAESLGLEHCTIRVKADVFKEDLINFCVYGDQPFSVSSGLGILSIARAARESGVKVLLCGDGADECFGGYSWYLHLGQRNNGQGLIDKDKDISFQNFGLDLSKRLKHINRYSSQKKAWAWHYYASELEKSQLFNPEYFETVDSSLRKFYEFKSDAIWEPEDYIKQDRQFYFPNEMLRKVDRMTMAFSVEGRAPFAAPSVLAHADKLKYSHLIRDNSLKWILRRAFSNLLPEEICFRPKHGFNVPIDHWLKNEWHHLVDETFDTHSALWRLGLIHKKSKETAKQLLFDPERLNGHTIFSFVMLNLWLENSYGNHC